MDNRFLNQFLKGRMALANDVEKGNKHTAPEPPRKTTTSIATIIEDCPAKSVVLDYFRKRIEELEDSDMD
jgi:hypothetical protein